MQYERTSNYRSRPVWVQAFQFGIPQEDWPWWFQKKIKDGDIIVDGSYFQIYNTPELTQSGGLGDYVVRGVDGTVMIHQANDFREHYEKFPDEVLACLNQAKRKNNC